jgi:hypothetical protein
MYMVGYDSNYSHKFEPQRIYIYVKLTMVCMISQSFESKIQFWSLKLYAQLFKPTLCFKAIKGLSSGIYGQVSSH